MADALLRIDGLTKRFGGVIASDGVDLALPAGELHAVIGPNGAGKTTLIGPVLGAAAYLLLELVLGSFTTHWQAIFGPILIVIVLFARRGLYGALAGRPTNG